MHKLKSYFPHCDSLFSHVNNWVLLPNRSWIFVKLMVEACFRSTVKTFLWFFHTKWVFMTNFKMYSLADKMEEILFHLSDYHQTGLNVSNRCFSFILSDISCNFSLLFSPKHLQILFRCFCFIKLVEIETALVETRQYDLFLFTTIRKTLLSQTRNLFSVANF